MNTPQTAKDTYNFCLVFSNGGKDGQQVPPY
jgi:hypothetical protein